MYLFTYLHVHIYIYYINIYIYMYTQFGYRYSFVFIIYSKPQLFHNPRKHHQTRSLKRVRIRYPLVAAAYGVTLGDLLL